MRHLTVLIAVAPILFFSIHDMTHILTYDETYIAFEPVDILKSQMYQWKLGNFRTTDIVLGLPIAVVSFVTGFSKDILIIFAKLMHWITSIFLVWRCVKSLIRIGSVKRSHGNTLFLFCAAALFPVCMLALKVFNYDAFSMLLGTLATFILLEGLLQRNQKKVFISVVLIALASQEKLIASPFLWIAIVIAGVNEAIAQKERFESMIAAFKGGAAASLYASVVFVFSFLLLLILRGGKMPSYNPINILRPLFAALWPLIRNHVSIFMTETNWLSSLVGLPLLVAGLAIFFGLLSACCALPFRKLSSGTFLSLSLLKTRISQVSNVILLITAVTGIVSAFLVKAFLYPSYPVVSGRYVPTHFFNGCAIHFNSFSQIGHIIQYVGWAYASFFVSIPTIWLVTAIILATRNISQKNRDINSWCFDTVQIVILTVPFLYGIMLVPVSARYLNLFLFLFILITACNLVAWTVSLSATRRFSLYGAILLAVFIEMYPFSPLFASFRPWWLNYPKEYMLSPSKGILNPWWMGWGEEVAIAGSKIFDRYRQEGKDCDSIKLYTNYQGGWLMRKPPVKIIKMDTCHNFTYSNNDYYIFNRMGVSETSLPFPDTVGPYITVEFRGFVQAWIFKGSDISGLFDRKKNLPDSSGPTGDL
jgi:hypothetical protein